MKRLLTIASIVTIMASSITVHATDVNYINSKMHYKNLYPKGFQHHIDNQGLAWNRTSELYQLKFALNRLLATV